MLHKSESAWIIWLVHLQAYICVAMFIVQIYSYCLFRHRLPGCYYCSSHSRQCSSQSFLCLWMFTHDRWTSLGGCIQHCRSAWQNGRSVYYSISNTADLHDKMEDQYTTVFNTADLRMTKWKISILWYCSSDIARFLLRQKVLSDYILLTEHCKIL